MDIMTVNKIRHIPITEGENLIGIISIGDVVKRLIEKFKICKIWKIKKKMKLILHHYQRKKKMRYQSHSKNSKR